MPHIKTGGRRLVPRLLLPRTPLGKWSVGFLTVSIVFFVAFFALVASGQKGGDTFFSNPWLSGTILPAAALAVASGDVGAIAEIRDRERSLGVLAGIALGLVVVIFVIGEIAFPH